MRGGNDQYRLRDGVSIQGNLIHRSDPLAVTRVNRTARSLLAELSKDDFRSVKAIAHSTDVRVTDADSLLKGLFDRGYLVWNPARDGGDHPAVSVVVTVRNEAETIPQLLDALSGLEYPEYEVVLVDDGSTDGTREVIRSSSLATSGKCRLVTVGSGEEPLGIGASRNRGVEKATNSVVAFTDADCRPESDWLSELVPTLSNHDVVGGRIRPTGKVGPIREYESHHSSLDMGPRASPVKRDSTTPYLPTANLIGHREVFEKHPFPERNVAEDVAVSWEALNNGFDLVYVPEGRVRHDFGDFPSFLRRRLSYGTSEAVLADEYGHPGSVPIPIISLLATILLMGWAIFGLFESSDFSIAGGFVASIILGFAVAPGRQSLTALRKTPTPPARVGRGLFRSSVSRIYGVAKEVTRYYSIPVFVVGVAFALLGYDLFALFLIGLSVLAVGISLLTDLLVQKPKKLVPYAILYVSDHLTYQIGAYRGAFLERCITHLSPLERFEISN